MVLKGCKPFGLSRALSLTLLLWLFALSAFGQTGEVKNATREEIRDFFQGTKKALLTFVGYSGAGYEDQASMLKQAEHILSEFDPAKTIVNIGATPEGIGGVYEIAKRRGFVTTGIVSAQAKQYNVQPSPYVDHVFYVQDATLGGISEGDRAIVAYL